MSDIAVISRNTELSRLIALEAELCGVSCRTLSRAPSDISGYGMLFIDTDTADATESAEGCVAVAITSDSDRVEILAGKYIAVLRYPFLLTELRSLIINKGVRVSGASEKGGERAYVVYADRERREIEFDGHRLALSENEFSVLCRLCESRGEAVSRAELDVLLGAERGNISDVYICRLRKKFASLTKQKVIYTVRNVGYMTEFSSQWI